MDPPEPFKGKLPDPPPRLPSAAREAERRWLWMTIYTESMKSQMSFLNTEDPSSFANTLANQAVDLFDKRFK